MARKQNHTRFSKKGTKNSKSRKPNWIYPGDLCWFKMETQAYPANDDWSYSDMLVRVMYPNEPMRYLKRTREGRGGRWVHHFECLGLNYVYRGSINDFTKYGPVTKCTT